MNTVIALKNAFITIQDPRIPNFDSFKRIKFIITYSYKNNSSCFRTTLSSFGSLPSKFGYAQTFQDRFMFLG
jgi:hypothetical protein